MSQVLRQMGSGSLQIVVLIFALVVGFVLYMKYKGNVPMQTSPGSTGNSGFSDQTNAPTSANDAGAALNQSPVLTPAPASTVSATQQANQYAIQNVTQGTQQNTTAATNAEVNIAVANAANGGTINFSDPAFRKALNDRITKLGGQVGIYVTGQKVAANWGAIVSAGPNVSSGSAAVAVVGPNAKTPANTVVGTQNDQVQSMLDNIAAQGYVLQKAKPTGYGTGLG